MRAPLTALPAGLPEGVLAILPRCWADMQSDRPTAAEVRAVFEEALKAGAASSPSPFAFAEKPPSSTPASSDLLDSYANVNEGEDAAKKKTRKKKKKNKKKVLVASLDNAFSSSSED